MKLFLAWIIFFPVALIMAWLDGGNEAWITVGAIYGFPAILLMILAMISAEDFGCHCFLVYGTHEETCTSVSAWWYDDIYDVCNKCGERKFKGKRQK